jgi:hypothetical protein
VVAFRRTLGAPQDDRFRLREHPFTFLDAHQVPAYGVMEHLLRVSEIELAHPASCSNEIYDRIGDRTPENLRDSREYFHQ